MLRVAGLTKRYGRVDALADVGFSVHRGEVLGLIGPNGSGKTTLFECLGGVLPFEAGRIETFGVDRRDLLFYLPDSMAPWPVQPVRWGLDFIGGLFGADPAMRERVIEELSLRPLLRTRFGALSKGQRKRAVLAMGLITPHPVLLADEPFDGLDLRQTRDIAATLRGHARDGRTIVLSIHQIADAARVCDRFVLLSGGRVRGEGTERELAAALPPAGDGEHALEAIFLALT